MEAWSSTSVSWPGKPAVSLDLFQPTYFLPAKESIPDTVLENPVSRSSLLIWQMIKRQQRGAQVMLGFFHPERESEISLGDCQPVLLLQEADGSSIQSKIMRMSPSQAFFCSRQGSTLDAGSQNLVPDCAYAQKELAHGPSPRLLPWPLCLWDGGGVQLLEW